MRKGVALAVGTTTAAAVVAAGAALLIHWKQKNEKRRRYTQRILRKFARECATPVSKLWKVADDLVSDMRVSLSSSSSDENTVDTVTSSSFNIIVAYTDPLPTGEEKGLYYGVNLRASELLILSATVGGKDEPISNLNREQISIPPNIMSADYQELFDYIASELARFMATYGGIVNDAHDAVEKLGFTFTCPVDQPEASLSGNVIKWKPFCVDDTTAKQFVDSINQALDRHGIRMKVVALVDDNIGDIAGGRYYNKDSVVAVSLGMGTNAAYIEPLQGVPKWQGPPPESGEMVVYMDWGSFESCSFPLTEFDVSLDAESSNPGSRRFEKLISGVYLGEIVRRVLLKMAQETALFGDSVPPKLSTPYLLRPPDMAAMHQDTSEDHEVIDEKLTQVFNISHSSPMAREVVAEVCDIVAERGARLAGAGIVGIINKLDRIKKKKTVVMVQGGLYEHYRVFRNYLHSGVWQMLGSQLSDNVVIQPCHGGSGAGAIFLAASQSIRAQAGHEAVLHDAVEAVASRVDVS